MQAVDGYGCLRRFYGAVATVVVMSTGATGSLSGALESAVYGPAAIAAYPQLLAGK